MRVFLCHLTAKYRHFMLYLSLKLNFRFQSNFAKAVYVVKSRINPLLSHHGRGSKLLLLLISLRVLSGRQKATFQGKNGKTCLLLVELNILDEKCLSLGAL